VHHDPDPTRRDEARALQGERGRAGADARAQQKAEREKALKKLLSTPVKLRSRVEIQEFLEGEQSRARAEGDTRIATAAARIAESARALLPIAELELENERLRRFIAEHMPDAAPLLSRWKG
jgi:hypothetical protein